jgi:pimeloyl-ACP methyl ester carboxylesterase
MLADQMSRHRRSTLQLADLSAKGAAGLSFLRQGQGRPILLLHGFAPDAEADWVETGWFGVLARAGYDVVAPDLRGHGHSVKSRDPADYRLDTFATDVEALREHCWGPRGIDLIGYSMGAHVAMALALATSARVKSLVLGGMGDRIAETVGLAPEFADALDETDQEKLGAYPPYAVRFRQHAATRTSNDMPALAACLRGQSDHFDLTQLATLTAATLVITGAQDKLTGSPYPVAARLAAGTGATVPNANHASALASREFRERVLLHLQRDFAMITAMGK